MGEGERKQSKEEKEKKRMRGKNKSMKRYLRKQRKNVIDPATVCSTPFLYSFHVKSINYLTSNSYVDRYQGEIGKNEGRAETSSIDEQGGGGREEETVSFGSV